MKAYHEQIVNNAVAYIALRYYQKTNKYIVQILMYKILALFDFQCLREMGEPCTELEYKAHKRGPVPQQLYTRWEDSDLVKKRPAKINNHSAKVFICVGSPNMDYFSDYEKNLLDGIIDRAVNEHWNAARASEVSHKEIHAWSKGRERPGYRMDYSDEFEGIQEKKAEQLTSAEQNFLLYLECANAKTKI